ASGSLVGLKQGIIPPTLNYETPDPDCPLNVVRNEPLATDNKLFLKISTTAFGQASASVICGV
ncbi:MAG: beta-ketoacyl-[acyl-carrier-protein] synthase family protein, partial [Planctomycetaceae bacterium]|nr:beta-ketoacyl-[acyl-carrier-protein] synthase family protein [Planctomycetaceae bacterium]